MAGGPVEHPQGTKPGGPPPVRGRAEQTLWGLEDLELRVMEDTDNDSVLMLRQMYLTSLAYKGLGPLSWSTRRSMGKGTPPLPHQVR